MVKSIFSKRKSLLSLLALAAMIFSSAQVLAQTEPPNGPGGGVPPPPPGNTDKPIRNVFFENISSSNTSEKSTYKISLDVGQALALGDTITFFIQKDGGCTSADCQASFGSASYNSSTLKGTWTNKSSQIIGGYGELAISPSVGVGFYSNIELKDIVNPKTAGDYMITVAYKWSGTGEPTEKVSTFKFPIGNAGTPPGGAPPPGGDNPPPGGDNPPPPPGQNTDQPVNLTGVVTDSKGNVIQDASIDVRKSDFTSFFFARTDKDGVYQLRGVPAGDYEISVRPPFSMGQLTPPDAQKITISSTSSLKTVNFTFTTSPKTLKGTVKTSTGQAITDAKVEGFQPGNGKFVGTETDKDGNYSISLGTGNWEINLAHPMDFGGGEFNAGEKIQWNYDGPAQNVSYKDDTSEESQTIDWTVTIASSTVTGTFVDKDGNGVEGFVDISSGVNQGRGMGSQTDKSGTFTLGVNAGRYAIKFFPSDQKYGFYENKFEIGDKEELDLGKIPLSSKSSSIKGTVVDQEGNAVEGVMVNAFTGGPGEMEKGAPGGPVIKHKKLKIQATPNEKKLEEPKFDDGFDLPKGCETPPGADQGKKEGDDEGNKTGRKFSVTATEPFPKDPKNDPNKGNQPEDKGPQCPNEHVGEFTGGPMQFDFGNATTGADGTFEVTVNEGNYQVSIGMGPESDYVPSGPPVGVTVKKDETVTGVELTVMKTDASVNVTVIDQAGKAYDKGFGFANCRKTTGDAFGAGGFFGAPLMSGRAVINVVSGSKLTCGAEFGPESAVSVVEEKTAEPASGGSADVQLTVMPDDATITGNVVDQNGKKVNQPIQVFAFSASKGSFFHREGRASNGSYTISVRGGRDYNIGYFMPGGFGPGSGASDYVQRPPDPTPLTVPANGTAKKDLTLLKVEAHIKGTIKNPDGTAAQFAFVFADQHKYVDQGLLDAKYAIETGGPSDENGKFDLGVIAGNYEVNAGIDPNQFSNSYMPPKTVELSIAKGKTGTANLTFRVADASISGDVKTKEGAIPMFGFCNAVSEDGNFSAAGVNGGKYSMNVSSESKEWTLRCNADVPGSGFYRSIQYIVQVPKAGSYTQDITVDAAGYDLPESVTTQVDASSSNTVSLPEGSSVEIPAGALADSGTITIVANPTSDLYATKGKESLAFGWELQAIDESGQAIEEFNSNVTFNMKYTDEYLEAAGLEDVETLESGYFDEDTSSWKEPEGYVLDPESQTLSTQTSHFTIFATLVAGNAASKSKVPKGGHVVAVTKNGGDSTVKLVDEKGEVSASWLAFDKKSVGNWEAKGGYFDGDSKRDYVVYNLGSNTTKEFRVFTGEGKKIAFTKVKISSGMIALPYDVDGDSTDEMIIAPSTGDSKIQVYQYNDTKKKFNLLTSFTAYRSGYKGGVSLDTGDLLGDGTQLLIVAPNTGAADIRTYQYNETKEKFTLFKSYDPSGADNKYGAQIKVGDVDDDDQDEIVSVPTLGAATVSVYGYNATKKKMVLEGSQMVFDATYDGGISFDVGNVDGDASEEVVVAPIQTIKADVKVYKVSNKGKFSSYTTFAPLGSTWVNGAQVMLVDVSKGGNLDLAIAPLMKASDLSFYDLKTLTKKKPTSLGKVKAPFGKSYKGGVFFSY